MTKSDNKDFSIDPALKIGPFVLRGESKRGKRVIYTFASVVAVFMLYQVIQVWLNRPPVLSPAIAVFFPDPTRASEGAFYQDGVVQQKGFDKAVIDSEGVASRLQVSFHHIKKEDTASDIMKEIRLAYDSEGATFFVMTMSSKVSDIRQHFSHWRTECLRNNKRVPVLIATVASAPGIADANNGILRWYVRSEEESTLLATYLRWKWNVSRVGVFYITRTPGQSDDRYGEHGMKTFRDQFVHSLYGERADVYCTTASTSKEQVTQFLSTIRSNAKGNPNGTGAYIIGYGDMVKSVITELLSQGFPGPIACTSTLTEPDWQPAATNADERIFTVIPRLNDPQSTLSKDDRNVVFFFAKQTLSRVITLTAKDPNYETFVSRWISERDDILIDQDFLTNGDIEVHLNIASAEMWR